MSGGEGRTPSPPSRPRLVGLLLLAAGSIVGMAALMVWIGGSDGVPAETPTEFDVRDAIGPAPIPGQAPSPPSATQSATDDRVSQPDTAAKDPASVVGTTTSSGTKAAAKEGSDGWGVGLRSGRLADLQAREAARPVRIIIPSISVDAHVDAVGYDQRRDEMEVPRSPEIAGWYEFGPAPGEEGSSVISAHVDWGGEKGAFFNLRKTEANALIIVEFDDGTARHFTASSRKAYDKDELPVTEIFRRTGRPTLTLITCGGSFNPSISSYENNIVVEAISVPFALSD